ncbi:eukaryotic translation initiation factor 3subunit 7 [Striga asiatica]|uniref:Eukaryotic translation initiation factor 3subunit 7 n=1 Tax=Striga asiatica TaxID=4170 RepID=A0A5A7PA67_STRAF|nr:eukaryotic translation initiation factor 3subunit 7 [Striga asiatica]
MLPPFLSRHDITTTVAAPIFPRSSLPRHNHHHRDNRNQHHDRHDTTRQGRRRGTEKHSWPPSSCHSWRASINEVGLRQVAAASDAATFIFSPCGSGDAALALALQKC